MSPAETVTRPDTRERILVAAAELFAQKGYAGTSTREIARAVGISQPSLFHHFPSKQAIVEHLLEYNLLPATAVAGELAAMAGPAAPRLYAYVRWDTGFLLSSPYQLAGLYTDDIMRAPEFALFRRSRARLHDAIASMVQQGVDGGEFIPIDAGFAQRVITSLNLITIDTGSGRAPAVSQLPTMAADFALRALLARPSPLAAVRRAASTVRALDGRHAPG